MPSAQGRALEYQSYGWAVFPLARGSKEPLKGSHGLDDATTDSSKAKAAFSEDFNVGISCEHSHLVVLDVDPSKGGAESLESLESLHNLLPPTVIAHTPRGGRHFYFKAPTHCTVPSSVSKIARGLDIRAHGGYVVAPDSIVYDKPYKWDPHGDPKSVQVSELPLWLLELILGAKNLSEGDAAAVSEIIFEGERNNVLASLAGSMRRRGMAETAIAAALIIENDRICSPPLKIDEVRAIAKSVTRYQPTDGALKPIRVLDGTENLTDLGNARRFVRLHGEDVRYVPHWKQWFIWNDQIWQKDERLKIAGLAKETTREIYAEAGREEDSEKRSKIASWAKSSESAAKISAMLDLARSEPGVPLVPNEFDRHPFLLTCANGILDLETGKLFEHQRKWQLTSMTETAYDPAAECPLFEAFIKRITNSREDLIEFLQRSLGYSLTGDTREHAMFVAYGTGRNGKSTLMEVMSRLMGELAKATPIDTLMATNDNGPRNDLARLVNARMVIANESEQGRRLAEAMIKQLTGDDPVACRFLYGELFEFRPKFKIWLVTNHKPTIRGGDIGIWSRIRLVPFEVRIPEEEMDKTLGKKLSKELPGILAWLVRGCKAWLKDGLPAAGTVLDATKAYREDEDQLLPWLEGFTVADHEARTLMKTLYDSYKDWAIEQDEHVVKPRTFGNWLDERGFRSNRGTGGKRERLGIRLRDSYDELSESDVSDAISENPETTTVTSREGLVSENSHNASLASLPLENDGDEW